MISVFLFFFSFFLFLFLFLIPLENLCNTLFKGTNFLCFVLQSKSYSVEKWGGSNAKFSMYFFLVVLVSSIFQQFGEHLAELFVLVRKETCLDYLPTFSITHK